MENVVELKDKRYPELLKKIKGAPKRLYYKGNWNDIFSAEGGPASGGENCLAVVGSRRLTSYGRRMTEILVSEIAAAGVTIVSGFMYGGDEAAHRATVEVGGRTIAVMPCGIDLIHPAEQADLYQKILENDGLIISEFPGDLPPQNWTYATRNRIVAGLSKAVLIVEAGLNSGTMITVGYAKKFGRQIFAVPGPLTSEVSKGTARLIKEGAEIFTEAKDVLDFYKTNFQFSMTNFQSPKQNKFATGQANSKSQAPNSKTMTTLEQKIIGELKREPLEADSLARELKMPVAKISSSLSLLQVKGLIKQEGNKYYTD